VPGFLLSPAAQADVDDIWNYTAEHWGVDQAEGYVQNLRDACEALETGMQSGRPVEIRAGYRKILVGAHVLFFKKKDDGTIVIMRILHQSMDVERHL
jgi:toxin ParE1/3/4